jgi:S-adenosylmethionine:tRNA ribosyltransferase-isomerase
MLLINLKLARSTLFMLVAALSGLARIKAAYAHAAAASYRFLSYGDACLIEVPPKAPDVPAGGVA